MAAGLAGRALGQSPPSSTQTNVAPTVQAANEVVLLPEPVPDPIEPFNRAVWGFNRGVMTGVIKPTARAYRFVVRKPLRSGIANFGRNITFPGRVINNLLQARWTGARDESYRFLCNTVLGVAGFVDVASKWQIPKSDADFGQTFGRWGWRPHAFIMLPIYGPSNERDTVGLAADNLANPLSYLTPSPIVPDNPLTYVSPYTYATYAVLYNNLSDTVDDYVRYARTEMDPYSEIAYAWAYTRDVRPPDFALHGPIDRASLETLQSIYYSFKDPKFPNRSRTDSVLIPATGQHLKYTFWLQPKPAPVVYIVPGLGSHRLASLELALAELVHKQGYSAVCVSNPFNYEFMQEASTAAEPGDTAVDARDLRVALTAIDRQLEKRFPGRIAGRALMGYSMGAFESLFVAATTSTDADEGLIKFDRYVAIDTPVRLAHGIATLDEFYQAPLAWPAAERAQGINNTFLKVAALKNAALTTNTALPFSGIESKFLIGVNFRLILRDVIYTSQERHNQGVLEHRIRKMRRDPVYREILRYSYGDYFSRFVVPYYRSQGLNVDAATLMNQAGDLHALADQLRDNPAVRVIVNRNDFLLGPGDLDWLQTTLSTNRLTIFDQGGHLGNLGQPEVQKAILEALDGLGKRPQ